MTDVNSTVESSTPEAIDLSTLTKAERQVWRNTGELPKKSVTADPEPAPSEETVTTESKKAAPASEAGKSQAPRRDNAEDRKAKLNEEIRELLEKRDALRVETQKPDVKQEVKAEPSPAELKEPNIDDYDGTAGKTVQDYVKAMAKYIAKAELAERDANRQREDSLKQTADSLKDARTRYTDWDAVAVPVIKGLQDKAVSMDVLKTIDSSKNVADLMYAIGGDKDRVSKLLEDAKTNPVEAIRQIAVYEYLVAEELSKTKTVKKDPEPPVTRAPKPATEVGGRESSTEDPGMAAARAGDYRTASKEWNRQALAGKR